MHKIMKFKLNIFYALIFHIRLCVCLFIFVPIKQLVNDENVYMLIIIFHLLFQIKLLYLYEQSTFKKKIKTTKKHKNISIKNIFSKQAASSATAGIF